MRHNLRLILPLSFMLLLAACAPTALTADPPAPGGTPLVPASPTESRLQASATSTAVYDPAQAEPTNARFPDENTFPDPQLRFYDSINPV